MSSLRDNLPDHTPDKNAAIDFGLTAVDAVVPVFGGVVADLSRGMLARRSEERQHEFNVAVVGELELVAARVDRLQPETILDSDEFMAAYERAARIAAESASRDKRARLAAALSRMGDWDDLSKESREFFFGLVARYSDLHVFLLVFFHEPQAWLSQHAPDFNPRSIMMGSIKAMLQQHVFPDASDLESTVFPALAELKQDGLADVPLTTAMSGDGIVASRISPLGRRFLAFLGDPGPAD
jgi:hypothetical protein